MRKLHSLNLCNQHFKTGKRIWSRGAIYEVLEIKEITINKGIFGLEETGYAIRLKNLNTGHVFEINEIIAKRLFGFIIRR